MKATFEYDNRQIIPRLSTSCISHNIFYNRNEEPFALHSDNDFNEILDEWNKSANIITAKELISSSLLFNKGDISEVKDAIKFIKKRDEYPNLIIETIISLLSNENSCDEYFDDSLVITKSEIYNFIKLRKKDLWDYPTNAIIWVDLAYYYTILGQVKKAQKCISTSLSINNHNRYILRSASRFYIHMDEADKAIKILNNSPSLLNDPWLLSAEISISEVMGRKSKNIKKAITLLNHESFSTLDVSELNGTIATLEFSSGNKKRGKKFCQMH